MEGIRRRIAVGLAALAPLTYGTRASAQAMPLPVKVQAAILKKALAYDRVLQSRPSPKFLVVGGPKAQADEIVGAFRELGADAAAARPEDLPARLGAGSVVYVLPGASSAGLKKLCAEKGVLSIAGVPAYAETGDVSVAVGLRADGKPELIVNLAQVRAEGHEFSAEMLKLAKVVR